MNIESLREYCMAKKGVEETLPFDESILVFKVMGKMFALTSLDDPVSANLKCDPERAIELREEYEGVKPGYHMNKKHWNTCHFNEDIPERLFRELIDHSYTLVVKGLKKADRELLAQME